MKNNPVTIVGGIIAVLLMLAIAIPSFVPSRSYVSQSACINNLRIIDDAKRNWAAANGKTNGDDVVISQVNKYITGNLMPRCPQGGVYSYNAVSVNATCSFVRTNKDGTISKHMKERP